MSFVMLSSVSAAVDIIAIAYVSKLKINHIKVPSIVAFTLLFIGEIIDITSPARTTISLFIEESIELLVSAGFLITAYYINVQSKRIRRK